MKRWKTLRDNLRRYAVLYSASALVLVVLAAILVVAPKLRRGDGWIGINARQDPARGAVVVTGVVTGSPAYDVGMLAGDRILSYDGFAIAGINALKRLIEDSYINQLVRIIIERQGVWLVADTRIAERPDDASIVPPVIPIAQGATPPHENRGLCIECHTIIPRGH
ncbi:MAG TPA: PDZ domain-containing protein [Sumerlaeia bacterium]|nr:PDZ domain-containing protein [Sumerlaeia bacterium]